MLRYSMAGCMCIYLASQQTPEQKVARLADEDAEVHMRENATLLKQQN